MALHCLLDSRRLLLLLFSWSVLVAVEACWNPSTILNGAPFPPLLDATLDDLAHGLEAGLFTSVDLVEVYTARILQVNHTLRAVTQLNPDALSIAAMLDSERAVGAVRGRLHGIPILLKDNIATADQMDNTAGSYALVGAKVSQQTICQYLTQFVGLGA
jgi:amidase